MFLVSCLWDLFSNWSSENLSEPAKSQKVNTFSVCAEFATLEGSLVSESSRIVCERDDWLLKIVLRFNLLLAPLLSQKLNSS